MRSHPSFKPLVTAAVGTALSLSATTAFAQMAPQTADMTVTGTIVPAACSATFDGDGTVDFGTIRLIDLPATDYYALGSKATKLSVTCSATKSVRFGIQDMQSGSKVTDTVFRTRLGAPGDGYIFGLGTGVADGKSVNLGGYSIETRVGSTVDGAGWNVGYSTTGTGTWSEPARYLRTGELYTPVNFGVPRTGTSFIFPLTITAQLEKGAALQVFDDTKLNGQAVFAITYQ